MTVLTRSRVFAGTVFAMALPLMAHHPFSSEFDVDKAVTLTGVVDRITWENPHVSIFITARNDGKTEGWQLEAASPLYLEQHGMKPTSFLKGSTITVHAYSASNNKRLLSARSITVNGKEMQVCDPKEDGGPAK